MKKEHNIKPPGGQENFDPEQALPGGNAAQEPHQTPLLALPAPDNELSSLVENLPQSDDPNIINNVGRIIYHITTGSAHGLQLFNKWSQGIDEDETSKRWDSFKDKKFCSHDGGIKALKKMIQDPAPDRYQSPSRPPSVQSSAQEPGAVPKQESPGQEAQGYHAFSRTISDPYNLIDIDFKNTDHLKPIPPDWVMEGRYMRGEVSCIIGQGGTGKSMLTILDAVSVATGKPMSGYMVQQPGNVLLCNLEDGKDVMLNRLLATVNAHGIDRHALPYNILTMSTPIDRLLDQQNGASLLTTLITDNEICLLILDPLANLHAVKDENDNAGMARFMSMIKSQARETNCAIGLVHHAGKWKGVGDSDQYRARGASSIIDAARVAHNLIQDDELVNLIGTKNNFDLVDGGTSYRKLAVELDGISIGVMEVTSPIIDDDDVKFAELRELVFEIMGDKPKMTTYALSGLVEQSSKNPNKKIVRFTIQRNIEDAFKTECTQNQITLVHALIGSPKPTRYIIRKDSQKDSHSHTHSTLTKMDVS